MISRQQRLKSIRYAVERLARKKEVEAEYHDQLNTADEDLAISVSETEEILESITK